MTSQREKVLAKCAKLIDAPHDGTSLCPKEESGNPQQIIARRTANKFIPVITALLDLAQRQNEALLSVQFDCDGIKTVQSVQAAIVDFNKTLSEIAGE